MAIAWSAVRGPGWAWWLFGASIALANGAGRLSARFLDREDGERAVTVHQATILVGLSLFMGFMCGVGVTSLVVMFYSLWRQRRR